MNMILQMHEFHGVTFHRGSSQMVWMKQPLSRPPTTSSSRTWRGVRDTIDCLDL